jgi:aminomethyltransferase
MEARLLRTPLYDWHLRHGGRLVDFAGWAMPVQYTSIIAEHRTTRSAVGIADISHMGRLRFEGPGAAVFLAELLTRRVADMELGQIRYSLVTNDAGGILDDVLVGYYHNSHGQPFFMLVVNASNRAKIVDWVRAHLPDERAERPGQEIIWNDVSRLWAMFAIQGPRSVEMLQPLVDADLQSMRYYRGAQVRILHPAAQRQGAIISRTGYTGEDGFELSLGANIAPDVWEVLLELGRPLGIVPTGLSARDTLRLEAGMPLYGHELSEHIDPFQAGLGFACHLVGYDFPGRDALLRLKSQPRTLVRIGLELAGKRAARQGCAVLSAGRPVGQITSGSYSPSLGKPIAMGYVPPAFAAVGTELQIDVRGQFEPARVVELPFYHRNKFANGGRANK